MNDNGEKSGQESPRLILLTQWFDPEPTFKGLVFAKALQRSGFNVEVVTGFPNYPGGKVYAGYRIRPITREFKDGVNITRLALFPSHSERALSRIANYLSFCLSCFLYLTFVARRADIVYVYHPPLTSGIAAAAAKLFRRTPTVIDVQDLWPDTLAATSMLNNRILLRIVGMMCDSVYRCMDHIVVLSPGFRNVLAARGVPSSKIDVIYNWADEASIVAAPRTRPAGMPDDGKFCVLFAGNMGRAQGLDTVIDAAKILIGKAPSAEFCFLGGGLEVKRLQQRVEDEAIPNVRFLPKVPMDEVGSFLAAADCLLVHLRSDPLFEMTIPSKTQAYMAAGKPVLIGVAGDAADLVSNAGCGLSFVSDDALALANAVEKLTTLSSPDIKKMGEAGRDYYFNHLSLDKGVLAFTEIFRRLITLSPSEPHRA